ncbi:MAG TPA: pyrroloquinoline quinone-dependent dehydrogenase [Vicinamibacterales bacterium]|nr:pyrroloquinoline quinone-dependent dehydrogenase [Vicinamibacterales bacterium]
MTRASLAASVLAAFSVFQGASNAAPGGDWPFYGHDAGGMRYSPLTQIDRANVLQLTVAWTLQTGDRSDGSHGGKRSGFEATPLVVDGTMYVTTGFNRVIAVDPATGRQRWTFDPLVELQGDYGDGLINRGVATWVDPVRQTGQACRRRLYEATLDARLIALDAATGAPCGDFGAHGQVSLRGVPEYQAASYHMTSPPVVIDGLVIVGSSINDNSRAQMTSGVVRAFDARTGALRWSWDPIPRDGSVQSGAANAWSVMAVDPERHLVFVPTGSASPDYYGGLRTGDNKWANSIVALHAETGRVAWGFQLVHHDLWDYDSASPPLLATIVHDGRTVPVVVQGNKTGFLYVLNRDTGVPVFPVEERPVPASDVPGEVASPTQPFPTVIPPVAPQHLTLDDFDGPDRDACRASVRDLRNDGIFTPPSLRGTLVMPGNVGGMNWSGYAFDPTRHLLVVNANVLPAKVRIIPRAEFNDRSKRTEDGDYATQAGTPYGMFRRFIQGPSDLPCNKAPWGLLTAIDLETGSIKWQVPLGSLQGFGGSTARIGPGAISLGGPIVTAGGIVFIAGTVDPFIRAFDIESGRELWKGALPFAGHATPMTYQLTTGGKQFLVIAAGGAAAISEEAVGDTLVAFALK